MADRILDYAAAASLVAEEADRIRTRLVPSAETVPLDASLGCVLAEAVAADRDLPPFPRSTRDGYACRAADLARVPAELRVVGQIKAGGSLPASAMRIGPGEAAEIMTGAAVPEGADCVVMLEHTEALGEHGVRVLRSVAAGDNIVPQGAEARAGAPLLAPGVEIGYGQVAALAAVGRSAVRVHARPRVAVLATGDELVPLDATPGPHQIRNSNTHSLAAQVRLAGGTPVPLPIAPDDRDALRALVEEGPRCDLLLLSGGVSMGKYDLVEEALQELGARFHFTGVQIQPGKPVVFGALPEPEDRPTYAAGANIRADRPFFGLPGNPLSTMVTFELFVRPVLGALRGTVDGPRFAQATLAREVTVKPGLTRFLPARATADALHCTVERIDWQGSGDLASAARSNAWLVVPPDREHLQAGEPVAVLLR